MHLGRSDLWAANLTALAGAPHLRLPHLNGILTVFPKHCQERFLAKKSSTRVLCPVSGKAVQHYPRSPTGIKVMVTTGPPQREEVLIEDRSNARGYCCAIHCDIDMLDNCEQVDRFHHEAMSSPDIESLQIT